MNLADISKLPPAMQAAAMADQKRATAARERIMAQISRPLPVPVAAFKADPALLGLPLCPGIKTVRPKIKHEESRAQQAVIRWFSENCYEWQIDEELLLGFPLQGARTPKNGARLKSEGMRKGTLDMLLNVPRGDCCSLWIEMKSSTGRLSPAQKLMIKRLTNAGSATVVCRSAEEAKAAIRAYLSLKSR